MRRDLSVGGGMCSDVQKVRTVRLPDTHQCKSAFTSFRQPMKLLLTGDPGRSAVLGLPPT